MTESINPNLINENGLAQDNALDDEQVEGIVVLTSRGVSDSGICMSLGISLEQLFTFRESENGRKLIAEQAAELTRREVTADDEWGVLEETALTYLRQRVVTEHRTLETHEMLAIARAANQAKRKHGHLSDANKMLGKATAGDGTINVQYNTVQLQIPHILLDRIQKVVSGNEVVQSESQLTELYGAYTNRDMDAVAVGKLLNVDVNGHSNTNKKNVIEDAQVMRNVFTNTDDVLQSVQSDEPI